MSDRRCSTRVKVEGYKPVEVVGTIGLVELWVGEDIVLDMWLKEAKALRKALKRAIKSQEPKQ